MEITWGVYGGCWQIYGGSTGDSDKGTVSVSSAACDSPNEAIIIITSLIMETGNSAARPSQCQVGGKDDNRRVRASTCRESHIHHSSPG